MGRVTLDHVTKRFDEHHRGQRSQPRGRRRGVPRAPRSVGVRQVHRAAHDRRSRDAHRRHDHDRRPRRERRRGERPRHRDGVPELRALSAHDRAPQHRVPAALAPRRRRRSATQLVADAAESLGLDGAARPQARAALGRPAPAGRARPRHRAAARRRSSWTSRSRTSTRSCACRRAPSSWSSSVDCRPRSCTSPTIRWKR